MVIFLAVNLSTEVTNKLRIYQEHFERQYIDSTREFYTVHGRACLSENGVQNYMTYVSFLLSSSPPSAGKVIIIEYVVQIKLILPCMQFRKFLSQAMKTVLFWQAGVISHKN